MRRAVRLFSSVAKAAETTAATTDLYNPPIVSGLAKGGLQNFGMHPNPKVQSLIESSTQLDAQGKYISWGDAGFTERDFLDVISFDKQCKAAGQTLQFGCTPEYKTKFESELSNQYESTLRAWDKAYSQHTQKVLAEDYLYLAGLTPPPKVPVNSVSFPLSLLIGLGIGIMSAAMWTQYSNRERQVVHHAANAWRLEGPDAPELRRP
eukprot:comp20762_c0_seq1/m.42754 comp20762_c0_seq1/g.42754  ORF comp20762_c0_seq1/g.42754 comp20762_c0_seq1/m.42754 type:complete len:207 (-) comp20762_c0_seq1:102-722(-)